MIRPLLSIVFFILVKSSFSQTFHNISAKSEGDQVIITYDLHTPEAGKKIFVRIYSSQDNFTAPLYNVSGDIGDVDYGVQKRIVWDAGPEITKYLSNISFRLVGEIIYSWQFITPEANGSLRRGKKNLIEWKGGKSIDDVTLQLITPNSDTLLITQSLNTKEFLWETPKELTKGEGYSLLITSGKDTIAQNVTIKRKIPFYLLAIPIIGTATIVGIISSSGGGESDLPSPIDPN